MIRVTWSPRSARLGCLAGESERLVGTAVRLGGARGVREVSPAPPVIPAKAGPFPPSSPRKRGPVSALGHTGPRFRGDDG